MKFENVNIYLIGNFLYKFHTNMLPSEFTCRTYFTKGNEIQQHFSISHKLVCSSELPVIFFIEMQRTCDVRDSASDYKELKAPFWGFNRCGWINDLNSG